MYEFLQGNQSNSRTTNPTSENVKVFFIPTWPGAWVAEAVWVPSVVKRASHECV